MSIRDKLVQVLGEHTLSYWSSDEPQATRCTCGWKGAGFDLHRVDAIHARFAVVERPDVLVPTDTGAAPGVKIWYLAGVTVTAGPGEVWTRQIFQNRGPTGARTLATVLLEAADHAEAQ